MKKAIFCVVLVLCAMFSTRLTAEACKFNPNCYDERTRITCGTRYGVPAGQHEYRADNGHVFICGVNHEESIHTVRCVSCSADYGDKRMVCNILHSICNETRYYVCNGEH